MTDLCYCNGAMSGGLPLPHPRRLRGCRYYRDARQPEWLRRAQAHELPARVTYNGRG